VPDPIFADPRLARIYDDLDPDRSDLDAYLGLAEELGARVVLDVGCGTGTFAVLAAGRGLEVVAVDPAAASLDVARGKAHADRVRWIHGDATTLPPLEVDLATITGNVAQVFLANDDLVATLSGMRGALGAGGRVVFEVRDPARAAWTGWNRGATQRRTTIPAVGVVEHWVDLVEVDLPLVSFRWTYRFESTGDVVTSDSTLRFRTRAEVEGCVARAGLDVREVRDAPDRPGLELVFVCARGESSG
jgi:SAM-dependent methyltransferase